VARPANATAIFSASADVSAYEVFDITATTIPRSRNIISDVTFRPRRNSPSWPAACVGSPASVTV
jgi:hypothetical protein